MNNEWQPIETAPTDGTPILCWCRPNHVVICWPKKKYLTGELVWTSDSCEDFGGYEYPTHWMPLPNGPESNQE